jgi:hypothetical protein
MALPPSTVQVDVEAQAWKKDSTLGANSAKENAAGAGARAA